MKRTLKGILIRFTISIGIGIASTLIFCGKFCYESFQNAFLVTMYTTILSYVLWEGNGLLSDFLTKKIPWEKKTMARLVLGVVSTVIYSTGFVAVWNYVYFVMIMKWPSENYFQFILSNVLVALLITAIISLFLHAKEFLKAWRLEALKAERLQHEQVQGRLKSLRDQLNPHFLFNSLNVLTSLVHKDADQAEQFIKKLSETYRYVLDKSEYETVPLSEELAFIENYLDLLRTRFGENLKVNWQPPATNGWSIPPLSLQLLIENAVKHNIISRHKPLTVSIESRDDHYLVIRNNIQPKSLTASSSGVGLNNIRARFAHLSDKAISIDQTDGHYEVALPLIHVSEA